MVLHSFHRFGDCDNLYFIMKEVDHYPDIENIVVPSQGHYGFHSFPLVD